MYVGLKQPRGDGERYVTPARAAAKETRRARDGKFLFIFELPAQKFCLYVRKNILLQISFYA